MTYYGARDLADSFRTVRKNTIQVAKDIPDAQYAFQATPEVESVGAMLAHIAVGTVVPMIFHGTETKSCFSLEDWQTFSADVKDFLGERVGFPPPIQPSSKSRFEMLLGVKEHEMHHRAKLMLIERRLGIVSHVTRARQAR